MPCSGARKGNTLAFAFIYNVYTHLLSTADQSADQSSCHDLKNVIHITNHRFSRKDLGLAKYQLVIIVRS